MEYTTSGWVQNFVQLLRYRQATLPENEARVAACVPAARWQSTQGELCERTPNVAARPALEKRALYRRRVPHERHARQPRVVTRHGHKRACRWVRYGAPPIDLED